MAIHLQTFRNGKKYWLLSSSGGSTSVRITRSNSGQSRLSPAEEENARRYEELRAAYREEFGEELPPKYPPQPTRKTPSSRGTSHRRDEDRDYVPSPITEEEEEDSEEENEPVRPYVLLVDVMVHFSGDKSS